MTQTVGSQAPRVFEAVEREVRQERTFFQDSTRKVIVWLKSAHTEGGAKGFAAGVISAVVLALLSATIIGIPLSLHLQRQWVHLDIETRPVDIETQPDLIEEGHYPVVQLNQLCDNLRAAIAHIQEHPQYVDRPYPVERVVEVEKVVEVPVDRIVEKRVEIPVDRVVERLVEVPVERVVEKRVEIPVERVVKVPYEVEKIVERQVVPSDIQSELELLRSNNRILQSQLQGRNRPTPAVARAHSDPSQAPSRILSEAEDVFDALSAQPAHRATLVTTGLDGSA